MTTAATAQDQANVALHAIGLTYHDSVPLWKLLGAIEAHGWAHVQAPGITPVFYSNKAKGKTSIPCWYHDREREQAQDALHRLVGESKNVPVTRRNLHFTWYRMESGRYEIVAYLS